MSTWKNIVLIICMQYGFDVRSSMHEGTQEIDMERDTPTTALMSHPGHALEVSEDTLMAELLPESTDSDDFLFFFVCLLARLFVLFLILLTVTIRVH